MKTKQTSDRNQIEFGFTAPMRAAVLQWSWYSSGGFKVLAVRSYERWLEFFTPLSRGNGGAQ